LWDRLGVERPRRELRGRRRGTRARARTGCEMSRVDNLAEGQRDLPAAPLDG
jgi:hypothetical protein